MHESEWQITEHQPDHFTIGWETEEYLFYVWFIGGRVSHLLNRITKVPRIGVTHAAQSALAPEDVRTLQEIIESLPKHLFEAARQARLDLEAAEDRVRELRARSGSLLLLHRLAKQYGFELRKAS